MTFPRDPELGPVMIEIFSLPRNRGSASVLDPNDPTVFQRQDSVSPVKDTVVMGDKQGCRPPRLSHAFEQIDHLGCAVLVQRGGGFVGQHKARAGNQCARDGDPLLLPTRQVAGKIAGAARQADKPEGMDRCPFGSLVG